MIPFTALRNSKKTRSALDHPLHWPKTRKKKFPTQRARKELVQTLSSEKSAAILTKGRSLARNLPIHAFWGSICLLTNKKNMLITGTTERTEQMWTKQNH